MASRSTRPDISIPPNPHRPPPSSTSSSPTIHSLALDEPLPPPSVPPSTSLKFPPNTAATVTFADCRENEYGMEMAQAQRGTTIDDLLEIQRTMPSVVYEFVRFHDSVHQPEMV